MHPRCCLRSLCRAGLPVALGLLACVAVLACTRPGHSSSPTAPGAAPAGPSPTGSPGSGGIQIYRFRIQQLDVIVAQSQPAQVSVKVSSYLPDSCTTARDPVITRSDSTVTVDLTGQRPTGVACSQIARPFQPTLALGTFSSGHYTLQVNDQQTTFDVP